MQILVIDRSAAADGSVAQGLRAKGIRLDVAGAPKEAKSMMAVFRYDLALIDLAPCDRAAQAFLADHAAGGNAPIIALVPAAAVLEGPTNSMHHLADDWMPKPVAILELLARIRAVRARTSKPPVRTFRAGGLTVSPDDHRACFRGTPLAISAREIGVLALLIRWSGHPVPRAMLETAVYGTDASISPNAIEAVLSRLRRTLAAADCPARIEAVRGLGWRLVIPNGDERTPT